VVRANQLDVCSQKKTGIRKGIQSMVRKSGKTNTFLIKRKISFGVNLPGEDVRR